ncbi:MAG: 2-dehydropantoate 2-reductase [Candidatus Eremiobacteraeota bacterium]|nr:2-dehydropantoate 2-reductase [Candidatus Eremiobacteraeota bacterium]MBC5804075.1 2-dehydropantoate 2-reductase [Candidatus Eremiobacteraeota bacterium]MBC5821650.1 2-dehydropantoate 2-reductase [Candidatus Eremiobacteraeota bacterium]
MDYDPPSRRSIGIIGAGALGTLFAVALSRAGFDVRVLVRDAKQAREIESRGGVALLDDPKPTARPPATADPRALAHVDAVLVAVKTYATESALLPLKDVLKPDVPIVSLQNGIVARDQIARVLGVGHPIALAPTTEAATSASPGLTRHTGSGETWIGWAAHSTGDDGALAALVAGLRRGGLASEIVSPVEPLVWGKLVINAAINPVTALAGVSNGALLENRTLQHRAMQLAREAAAVALAEGVRLPFGSAGAEVKRVVRMTAQNRSSMLQDLERGMPTEIEALNGEIVRRARTLGIAVPENARVLDEVRARRKA